MSGPSLRKTLTYLASKFATMQTYSALGCRTIVKIQSGKSNFYDAVGVDEDSLV